MKVNCLYDKLIKITELKSHPKNRNKHPKDQIDRLAKILEYQGWRYPIKVSKRSGYVTSGHGRIEAAKLNGWKEVPVNFQDYENEAVEYADVQADNAIASWSELDLKEIKLDVKDLGLDLDLLGLNTIIDETNAANEETEWVDLPDFNVGEAHIKLILQFKSEKDREDYVKNNNIEISKKMSKQWISIIS